MYTLGLIRRVGDDRQQNARKTKAGNHSLFTMTLCKSPALA